MQASLLVAHLSLSLLHEDRMRLSIKIKPACFSTFDFHYLCTIIILILICFGTKEERAPLAGAD